MTLLNGFTVCPSSSLLGNFRVPGTTRSLRVRRDIAPLLIGAAAQWHAKVEPITIDPFDDWAYSCRRVRGRVGWSFHSSGCAIDLNATRHPMGRRGTVSAKQRATILAICKTYGLRWGGTFERPDEMHLEVALSKSAALALAARLQKRPATPAKIPPPNITRLRMFAQNSDVVRLQQALRARGFSPGLSDGIYGVSTRDAVARFQRAQGWSGRDADGQMGPLTLRRLFG